MAQHHNFKVKNGLEVAGNTTLSGTLTLGGTTVSNLLDSAAVATIARDVAFDSDGEINADPAGTAVALAIALG